MYYLIRNLMSPKGGEIWHSSPVADDLNAFLQICRENWEGTFEVLPDYEVKGFELKFKTKDWSEHFE